MARLFVYLSSFISQILDFFYWLVCIFIFDGVTVKTENSITNQYMTMTKLGSDQPPLPYIHPFVINVANYRARSSQSIIDALIITHTGVSLPQSPSQLFTNFNSMLFIYLLCSYFYLLWFILCGKISKKFIWKKMLARIWWFSQLQDFTLWM